MGNQIARLFLRGSLMNESAKLLTKEENDKVTELMMQAWDDPNIQNQKMEFYQALARTIGSDYKNMDHGKADAMITFWKAAVLVLYHESKQCKDCRRHFVTTKSHVDKCTCGGTLVVKWAPKPQIALDPIKRKKFFQAVMFNYLKQIFRENKPPSFKETRTEQGAAPDVALRLITSIIGRHKDIQFETQTIDIDHHVVKCETGLIPLKSLRQIIEFKNDLEQHGVQISLDWNTININCMFEVSEDVTCTIVEKVYAKFTSLDTGSDDDEDGGFRDHCENRVITKLGEETHEERAEYSETLEIIRSRLTEGAQKLFDLYLNLPQDYVDRFKTDKPWRKDLAEYLGVTADEIDDMRENIRLNMLAMDMGSDL